MRFHKLLDLFRVAYIGLHKGRILGYAGTCQFRWAAKANRPTSLYGAKVMDEGFMNSLSLTISIAHTGAVKTRRS